MPALDMIACKVFWLPVMIILALMAIHCHATPAWLAVQLMLKGRHVDCM